MLLLYCKIYVYPTFQVLIIWAVNKVAFSYKTRKTTPKQLLGFIIYIQININL